MLSEKQIFDLTLKTTVDAIEGFARSRLTSTANFQVLDLIMPKERNIRSIVGGLETSLGTRLWEPLAEALAVENGFTVLNGRHILEPVDVPVEVAMILNDVQHNREHGSGKYDSETTKLAIQEAWGAQGVRRREWRNPPRGHGIDVWLNKDDVNYVLDTKTVQPNIGSYQRFMRQIINWYLYFYAKYPTATLEARVVFPYNPYAPADFWENTIGGAWPLEPEREAWVQDDLWDLCTGNLNSFSMIERAFTHIGEEGLVTETLDHLFKEAK